MKSFFGRYLKVILIVCLLLPSGVIWANTESYQVTKEFQGVVNQEDINTNYKLNISDLMGKITPKFKAVICTLSFIVFVITFMVMSNLAKPYKKLHRGTCYVGFWRRFAAEIIDYIIIVIMFSMMAFFISYIRNTTSVGQSYNASMTLISVGLLIMLCFSYMYNVLFQRSKYQATLGMMVMKFKIYNEDLNKVGFWRLSGRYFSQNISALILCIGYFMIGWTKRKQGLHDIVARTVCVRKISPLE